MHKKFLALLLVLLMVAPGALAGEISLSDVNNFLNTSAKLGEGSKANAVAVVPFSHIDGPKEEDLFYAFVPFKYVSRNYVKYQIVFISCTCRPADLNVWSTAYAELTLPSSGKIADSEVKFFSFDSDSTGHYLGGFWGDSDPPPTSPNSTYAKFKAEMIPYYVGKTYAQLKGFKTISDFTDFSIDAWTGATVSSNNILRAVQALFAYHATDSFFDGDPEAVELRGAFEGKRETAEAKSSIAVATTESELPAPVDTTKKYLANKDDKEETLCTPGNFGPTCSAITNENLRQYLGRSDVMYIDLRDFEDYAKKHLRNFECIPYLSLIFNAEAHKDSSLPQLYGGTTDEPIPVYKESDEILAALFPKNKNIFLMCQGGGRVNNMMKILKARGWDMSKIYNIGGMAHYATPAYRDITTDTPEVIVKATYNFEGLTRNK
ncbi:MAG: FMN-binding protein [Synergistaceae bacterium]|nr:FMN-binding protein [Synergistaceae bacterium]